MKADKELDPYFYITGWIGITLVLLYAVISKVTGFHLSEYIPPCTLHEATGFYCPGCGGTRAICALFSGHIIASAFYHPFVAYALLLGGWFMLSQTIEKVSHLRLRIGMHYRPVYLWIGLSLILINFLVKNAVLIFFGITLI